MDFIAQMALMTGFGAWWWIGFKLGYFSRGKREVPTIEHEGQTLRQPGNVETRELQPLLCEGAASA